MSIALIILQMNPVFTKSTRNPFFKKSLLTSPEQFKIFKIYMKQRPIHGKRMCPRHLENIGHRINRSTILDACECCFTNRFLYFTKINSQS
jgi:hypothetical protein